MDIGKSFSYQFEDKQWITKLSIGALISLVPVLNAALTGYMVGIIRNVAANDAEPLPDWDHLGENFREGIVIAAASLVYATPIIILICLPLGALALSGAVSQNGDWQELGRSLAGASGVLFACVLCLFILYIMLLSVIHPAILVIFSREGTFASCFKLREIIGLISHNAGAFFTTWIVTVIGGIAIGLILGLVNFVVGWIPCVGWMAGLALGLGAAVYIITINGHLFGQFRIAAFAQLEASPAVLSP
jgi:hypothetical protein